MPYQHWADGHNECMLHSIIIRGEMGLKQLVRSTLTGDTTSSEAGQVEPELNAIIFVAQGLSAMVSTVVYAHAWYTGSSTNRKSSSSPRAIASPEHLVTSVFVQVVEHAAPHAPAAVTHDMSMDAPCDMSRQDIS